MSLIKQKNKNIKHPTVTDILEDTISKLEAYSDKIDSLGLDAHDQNKQMAELDAVLPRLKTILESAKRLDSAYDTVATSAKK